MIILSVSTEDDLNKVIEQLESTDLLYSPFYEPDIGNQLTAIAIEPSQLSKKFCSRFKLAMKE